MSEVSDFRKAYQALNANQKQAVDTIEGPVMVVAGPGTGKTQLLGVRVANILRQTDTLPSNILCLTFTESAATAMRARLVGLMGRDAYKVAVHTFHSFGSETINNNADYFYQGAHFRPADELSSYEVLEGIFQKLPPKSPLAASNNGEFTALRDTQRAIAELKRAGLTPDELEKILDHNDVFIGHAEPILGAVFDLPRLGKKDLPAIGRALSELEKFQVAPLPVALWRPLAEVCTHELAHALREATERGSTQPVTAWRNAWLERDAHKRFVFKDRTRTQKLRQVIDVYRKYLLAMQERELYDFDDMILRVVHALEVFPELRYNLQEQYLYILVDEFQDTNGAQLRLLRNLTSSDVNEGRPNILVVGDDDQAIYAFQGAELSNILDFRGLYRQPLIVTLTDNYRSTDTILGAARSVITQGSERLETVLEGIDKTLVAHAQHAPTLSELHRFANPTEQYQWIATRIKQLITDGTPGNEIAVLGRNHRQLLAILPYLRSGGLPINYERRSNVLEAEHIVALVLLARVIVALGDQRYDIVEALLPELLSQPFWRLPTDMLWQLSINAYQKRRFWLEMMLGSGGLLKNIAEFLIVASHDALHQPLEVMLDRLLGSNEPQVPNDDETDPNGKTADGPDEAVFHSPLRDYYFNQQRLDDNPASYLGMLSNLAVIRRKLREYRPDQTLNLGDFVDFVELHASAGMPIVDTAEHFEDGQAIQLMTAHKAKGLEFDTVFMLSCQDDVWGSGARTRASGIRFPHNLPLTPAGQTDDDCLRLFFVAMTRARAQLYLCGYRADDNGRENLTASFLQDSFMPIDHAPGDMATELLQTLEPTWQLRHLSAPHALKQELLRPQLATYQLSATHLNNFLDVSSGGPQAWLLQNLLRFPQAKSAQAAFGSAIHAVLQRAHVHLASSGERRPVEDILHDFELQLQNARLSDQDFEKLLEQGSDILPRYLAARYDSFTPDQIAEYSFRDQGVVLDDVRLTGAIDLMQPHAASHAIAVTDYKTGRAASSWVGRTDYEKIKLHKYRQQLMMYKLLVEGSRNFGGRYHVSQGVIEFVEPDGDGAVQRLELTIDREEFERFKRLVAAVWKHIMTLDMPDVSRYPMNYKGMATFEEDLLAG